MRLSTRFGIGAALAVLPLFVGIAYCVDGVHALAKSNERITGRQLLATQMSAGVILRLDRLQEYLRKYSVSEDRGYAGKIRDIVGATQEELDGLASSELSSQEAAALAAFAAAWREFVQRDPAALEPERLPTVLSELEELVALATEVQQEARETAEVEAQMAVRVREETSRTAVGVAVVAIILSYALIFMIVRSLRARLDELIVATRAVSRGTLSFQLDARWDDELGHVARAFNRMIGALQQLERMKGDFISSVSHELKTPLVAMLETNNLLLDEVPGPLTDMQQRMLKLNTQAAQRLSHMITDLLDLSRLKAGIRYNMAEHDLFAATQNAVSEFEAYALEHDITLRARLNEGPLFVRCDCDRYVQVVQNLVENAIKYTPAGGTVEVSLRRSCAATLKAEAVPLLRSVADEPVVVLSVEDSGPGIPEPDRERVFEKFFRREGHASDGGVGLGLAICREIVEAHGGTIWVAQSVLGGTRMQVAIPIEKPLGPMAESS